MTNTSQTHQRKKLFIFQCVIIVIYYIEILKNTCELKSFNIFIEKLKKEILMIYCKNLYYTIQCEEKTFISI
jgi:hypothetical protein